MTKTQYAEAERMIWLIKNKNVRVGCMHQLDCYEGEASSNAQHRKGYESLGVTTKAIVDIAVGTVK